MRRIFATLIILMMPLLIFGQSYASLWKKVKEAEEKDLPKTACEVLQKIVKKAEKGHDYGQLLKAELQSAQMMAEIAPDSLKPAIERMRQRAETEQNVVLKTVYQTVLYQVSRSNTPMELKAVKPQLTPELCEQLAKVKDKTYAPFVIEGVDSKLFGHDLLSVVGYALDEYKPLYEYYAKKGNRPAACITAARAYEYATVEQIDSLINVYQDVPEVGELALVRYDRIRYDSDVPKAEKLAYIREALGKWGSWKRMGILRNAEQELINPQFQISFDHHVVRPQETQKVTLQELRNITGLTLTVYRLKANGDLKADIDSEKGYKKIVPLLDGIVDKVERQYTGRQDYELFEDSLTIGGLPIGVYMLEFTSSANTKPSRHLYYVTDVFTISEALPEGKGIRYVVVNATTGQPIAGAHLTIREQLSYNEYKTHEGVTDAKGEYIGKLDGERHRREVYAYTDTDKACPEMTQAGVYRYLDEDRQVNRTSVYTDRGIYRPGQTVHASALIYEVRNGFEHQVREHKPVKFVLRDANNKVVEEKQVLSDEYGVAAVDFTLPEKGLTGQFRIQVNGETLIIHVEEYKRPTFHVDFPEVKQAYAAGDTITVEGTALSYAGVPLQDAKVSYKVVRRAAFWWWSYSRYWDTEALNYSQEGEELLNEETITDQEGKFKVRMPLDLPESSSPMFYQFVVTADVTDVAGETRTGQLSLPLGNRKTALSVDMAEKILLEEKSTATFHLLNAAGQDLDAEVNYQIDGGSWQKARTNSPLSILNKKLTSGKHTLDAICEGDTIRHEFVLFSLDDTKPATETDNWFYQSAAQFPNDGSAVTIQVGSSDKDVHLVYGLFAGTKIIEMGTKDMSNELLNLKLKYDEAYGDGLLLSFAWVKNGQCYTHTVRILRPLPDKHLSLEWATFRDRLTPGQKEEWTLKITDAEGRPADAQLMATLYDQSLNQIVKHQWSLQPDVLFSMPRTNWQYSMSYSRYDFVRKPWRDASTYEFDFSRFDERVLPSVYGYSLRRYSRGVMLESKGFDNSVDLAEVVGNGTKVFDVATEPKMMEASIVADAELSVSSVEEEKTDDIQLREDLNETAFFYPQLTTDEKGQVALKFTLPESLTTWRFLGLAHTKDLCYGQIEATAVAQKDVMIQPNVPRFIREGDEATISARIFCSATPLGSSKTTSEKLLNGTVTLKLTDPETNAVVFEQKKNVKMKAGATVPVSFEVRPQGLSKGLLICQMTVSGKGFSDGEQHYLPVLPSTERVTVTLPITQHQAVTETIDLLKLVPADAQNTKLTLEYTNDPAWLMIQALPAIGQPIDDNAISQAASYYANSLGRYVISRYPQAKTAFALWKQEKGEDTSLTSALEKNQELKDLLLSETPWVMDADNETEQKQRLVDFFDDNLMQNRISTALGKLGKLQLSDGSWTWWQGMPGSFYMTVAVSEMLVRLNAMAGKQSDVENMLSSAFSFMGQKIVDEVKELKKQEKENHQVSFPSFKTLQWLYLVTLDGRQLPAEVQSANDYLLKLLKKDVKSQSIYEKALTAVILSKSDAKRALEYAQSLKEYTVYREEMGRYYDTPRAGYSWYDYKIPTQTVAIEALQRLVPEDQQTIDEMQRWLLQEKRTQAWNTPINSVNAVYAFLASRPLSLSNDALSVMKVDGKPMKMPKATAAIGYVKTDIPAESKTLTIDKKSEGTSWGAVYAQFTQATKDITDSGSALTVKREILPISPAKDLAVGDRVKVRLTITADRDYDFVQVIDKRAACMEPVRQLSGYHSGSYCAPKDNATNYYFDCLSKGRHVIENEYYIDRPGTYETGTCSVECAYAPEFRAVTKSQTITVK